jgi:poly(hydroxyalkanoate) granule-associated protein
MEQNGTEVVAETATAVAQEAPPAEQIDILDESLVEDNGNSLLDGLRRVLMAGIGAFVLAQEEIEEFVTRLVERGEIAEQDGRRLVSDVIEGRARAVRNNRQKASEEMDKRIERALSRLNIPTTEEINNLSKQIDILAKKIDDLQKA